MYGDSGIDFTEQLCPAECTFLTSVHHANLTLQLYTMLATTALTFLTLSGRRITAPLCIIL